MVELDLDIITQNKKTVKIFGKEVAFKHLTVRENLSNEAMLQELDELKLADPDDLIKSETIIAKYLMKLLELTEEEANMVTLEQFQKLKEYLERKAMYDKGFNDREIDAMEKKAVKKQIAQK